MSNQKDTISLIEISIEMKGILKTAEVLGHDDTDRIKRWVRDQEIPKTQLKGVHELLIKAS